MIINAALGDGKGGPPKPGESGVKNLGEGHTNVDDAVASIMKAMTF